MRAALGRALRQRADGCGQARARWRARQAPMPASPRRRDFAALPRWAAGAIMARRAGDWHATSTVRSLRGRCGRVDHCPGGPEPCRLGPTRRGRGPPDYRPGAGIRGRLERRALAQSLALGGSGAAGQCRGRVGTRDGAASLASRERAPGTIAIGSYRSRRCRVDRTGDRARAARRRARELGSGKGRNGGSMGDDPARPQHDGVRAICSAARRWPPRRRPMPRRHRAA